MPTKAELEDENAELRAENVQLKAGGAGGCCDRLCPCGIPYDTPCFSHQSEDMADTCICPDHPEQAPEPRRNV